MPELQRGKSDLELIRSKRHHHHHASSTTPAASPSSQQLHQQHSSSSAGSPQQQNMNGAMSARTRLERSRKIGIFYFIIISMLNYLECSSGARTFEFPQDFSFFFFFFFMFRNVGKTEKYNSIT